jgi:hypothetical protein
MPVCRWKLDQGHTGYIPTIFYDTSKNNTRKTELFLYPVPFQHQLLYIHWIISHISFKAQKDPRQMQPWVVINT